MSYVNYNVLYICAQFFFANLHFLRLKKLTLIIKLRTSRRELFSGDEFRQILIPIVRHVCSGIPSKFIYSSDDMESTAEYYVCIDLGERQFLFRNIRITILSTIVFIIHI